MAFRDLRPPMTFYYDQLIGETDKGGVLYRFGNIKIWFGKEYLSNHDTFNKTFESPAWCVEQKVDRGLHTQKEIDFATSPRDAISKAGSILSSRRNRKSKKTLKPLKDFEGDESPKKY